MPVIYSENLDSSPEKRRTHIGTGHLDEVNQLRYKLTSKVNTPSYVHDRLGEYAYLNAKRLRRASSWRAFVKIQQGPPNLHPLVKELPHPAAPLLDHFEKEEFQF